MTDTLERLTAALADRYRVERDAHGGASLLGQGGMATVYLAEDLKHHRQVAIKVLRPELSALLGAERFLKEIETTANLQHPHILPLFDSGSANSFLFYVMPFVEGESLRDRLTREKQLAIPEAVRIATEVAGALDYAHRHGVIHRDVKPENILLHDGRALVADFGIALAMRKAGGARLTETGLSLGTPQYMSPEQATAERELDARTDIYALGAVTYEMLTGEPPFMGTTTQAIIAKLMTEAPRPVSVLRKAVPEPVQVAVLTALEKLPADRWGSAAEFGEALGGRADRRTGGPAVAGSSTRTTVRLSALVVVATVATLVGVVIGRLGRTATPMPPVTQFTIRAPAGDSIDRRGGIAVSRDGRRIVFAAVHGAESRWRLYLRDLGGPDANPIPGTEGAEAPFFSPDGRWLAYVDGNTARLMKLELPGGSPQVICNCGHVSGYASIEGAEWGEDGWIILGSWLGMQGLRRVNASGGRPEPMPVRPGTFEPDEYGIIQPHRLPGGRVALVGSSRNRVATIDLRTGERKRVIEEAGSRTTFLDREYLVYDLGNELWAVRFDAAALKTRGDPVRVIDGIGGPYTMSPAGTLVFPPVTQGSGTWRLVRVDRNDLLEPIGGMSGGWWGYPRVASDGGRVVAVGTGPEPGNSGLWVFDLNRHQLRRLGDRSRDHFAPLFTPDGKRIVFTSPSKSRNAWNLHWILSDGTGEAEQLTDTTLTQQAVSWLPDGTTLAFQRGVEPKTGWDMYLLPLAGDRTPKPLLVTPANERAPAFSPDGRWLAYVSDEGGRNQVYLRRYPEIDAPVQVSNDGGDHPVWSRDGGEIFFVEGNRILVTSFRDGVLDKPRQVADGNERPGRNPFGPVMPYGRHYDVMPDGRHLIVVQTQDQNYRLGEYQVVLNLGTELRRLLPLE